MELKEKIEKSDFFKNATDINSIKIIFNELFSTLPEVGQRWKHSFGNVWIRVSDDEGENARGEYSRNEYFYSYREGDSLRRIVTTQRNYKDIIIL